MNIQARMINSVLIFLTVFLVFLCFLERPGQFAFPKSKDLLGEEGVGKTLSLQVSFHYCLSHFNILAMSLKTSALVNIHNDLKQTDKQPPWIRISISQFHMLHPSLMSLMQNRMTRLSDGTNFYIDMEVKSRELSNPTKSRPSEKMAVQFWKQIIDLCSMILSTTSQP